MHFSSYGNTSGDGETWFGIDSAVPSSDTDSSETNGTVTVTFYDIYDGTDTECGTSVATGCSISATINVTYDGSGQFTETANLAPNPLSIYFPALSAYLLISFPTETQGTNGKGSDIGENIEVTYSSVPEPASLTLFGTALAGLGALRRRRTRRDRAA